MSCFAKLPSNFHGTRRAVKVKMCQLVLRGTLRVYKFPDFAPPPPQIQNWDVKQITPNLLCSYNVSCQVLDHILKVERGKQA